MSREMKDSGILAIGAIPKEWKPIRIKYLLQKGVIKSGPYGSALKEVASADGEYPIYNQANIINDDFSLRRNYISSKDYINMKRYKIHSGDIVFSMMGTVGKCSIVPEWIDEGIIDSHLFEATLNCLINKDYFKYSYDKDLCVQVIEQFIEAMNGSIMSGLNGGLVKNSFICLPSPTEQQQIVHFLDRKCTAIDTAIEKTKKSIEKLEEYKKAVITKAVTKGIDPNARMKNSGVEWIGEIPEGWEVNKFKFHAKAKSEKNPGNATILSLYREYGIVIKDSRDDNHNRTSLDTSSYRYVEVNDFVVNKMKAWQGSVAVSEYTGVVSPAYYVYKITDAEIYPIYLHYLLRSCYKDEFRRLSGGIRIGQWDLPSDALENTFIIQPSYTEQVRITEYIQKHTTVVEQLIEKKKKAIEKWEEYKKSLIYYAVTGKIDCRNEVIE